MTGSPTGSLAILIVYGRNVLPLISVKRQGLKSLNPRCLLIEVSCVTVPPYPYFLTGEFIKSSRMGDQILLRYCDLEEK